VHLNHYPAEMPRIVSSIVIERMIGFFVLTAFSLLGVAIVITTRHTGLMDVVWLNVLVIVAGLAAFGLSVFRGLHQRAFALAGRVFPALRGNKLVAKLKEAYQAYQQYQDTRRSLLLFVALTAVETAIPLLSNYFAGRALNLSATLVDFVVIIPVTLFIQRIPFTPSMLGVREGVFVVLFGLAGLTSAQAFSLSALHEFLVLVACLPGLLFYFLHPLQRRAAAGGAQSAVEGQTGGT
jgi:glycosyltransferase 2 family protein